MFTGPLRAVGILAVLPVLTALLSPATLAAPTLEVPIRLDFPYLRNALLNRVYTDAEQTARVWDDGSGCNFLVLSEPRVSQVQGRLQILTAVNARAGTPLGKGCLTLTDWQGSVEVQQAPVLGPRDAVIQFEVVESHLYDAEGAKTTTAGRVWDWVKRYVHPELARFTLDLRPTLGEVRSLLPTVLPATGPELERLLASVAIERAEITETGVTLTLGMEVPDAGPAPPPVAEPALSPQELARLQASLESWDAFVTFAVLRAAGDTLDPELRLALLEILLDVRSELVLALEAPADAGPDPVRRLFLDTWDRLGTTLRRVGNGLAGPTAWQYLSFISAADALRALDALGPQTGLEISTDGLRRLARILAPDAGPDPLEYTLEVNPLLRDRFGFGPPLPRVAPPAPRSPLSWLIPEARASPDAIAKLAARLDRWVPDRNELPTYLPLVRDLLHETAKIELTAGKIDAPYHSLYRNLVLATAWQETCWRHYVRSGKTIRTIRSGTGSVGLMQVNQKVWRGFYDVESLNNDIGYNALAGSEILSHYLVDYAIQKKEHEKTGRIENLARATYAMYNGGPRHLRRYRAEDTKASLRKIDQAFWEKYRTIQAGDELAVIRCFGEDTLDATGKTWVLAQNPERYTVQLLSSRDEAAVTRFLAEHRLGKTATYYRFQRDGKTWYSVITGSFADRAAAEAEAKRLSGRIRGLKPWVRSFADLRRSLGA